MRGNERKMGNDMLHRTLSVSGNDEFITPRLPKCENIRTKRHFPQFSRKHKGLDLVYVLRLQ